MSSVNADWLVWAQLARDLANALTFVAFLAAGLFGLFRYLRSERLRQTEQVVQLYRMFFESDRYRFIRFVIANPTSAEYAALSAQLATGGLPGELEGQLIDLLNFFEFVSGLTRRGLVARRDVDWMFANFIERLTADAVIRPYLLSGDYHELALACRKGLRR